MNTMNTINYIVQVGIVGSDLAIQTSRLYQTPQTQRMHTNENKIGRKDGITDIERNGRQAGSLVYLSLRL